MGPRCALREQAGARTAVARPRPNGRGASAGGAASDPSVLLPARGCSPDRCRGAAVALFQTTGRAGSGSYVRRAAERGVNPSRIFILRPVATSLLMAAIMLV